MYAIKFMKRYCILKLECKLLKKSRMLIIHPKKMDTEFFLTVLKRRVKDVLNLKFISIA